MIGYEGYGAFDIPATFYADGTWYKTTSIGVLSYAFTNTMVSTIIIPETVTYIEPGAFMELGYLYEVVINSKNLNMIEYNTFRDCSYLYKITIPASVTYIGDYAFVGCTNLTEINFGGTSSDFQNMITYGYGHNELSRVFNAGGVIFGS